MKTVKQHIIDLLKSTNRKGIEQTIEYLETNGFFECAASLVHQNHYIGGLADHSFATFYCANELKQNSIEEDVRSIPRDSVVIASLLHDVCKMFCYMPDKEGNIQRNLDKFPIGHGEKSVIMLLRQGLDLTESEMLAIRWHMGVYSFVDNEEEGWKYVQGRLKRQYNLSMSEPLCSLISQADNEAFERFKTQEDIGKIMEKYVFSLACSAK